MRRKSFSAWHPKGCLSLTCDIPVRWRGSRVTSRSPSPRRRLGAPPGGRGAHSAGGSRQPAAGRALCEPRARGAARGAFGRCQAKFKGGLGASGIDASVQNTHGVDLA